MYVNLHKKCLFLSDFNKTRDMQTNFSDSPKYEISQKPLSWE
jgi:hypothetical protein